MGKDTSDGKRHLLPQVPRRWYRTSQTKLTLILTWVGMLLVLTGQASAAEAPDLAPTNSASAKEILASIKPAASDKLTSTQTLAVAAVLKEDPPTAVTPVATTDSQPPVSDKPAPEISFEVTSAQYVPPPPPPAKPQLSSYSSGENHFPYGYCTWYVASRRYVPWSGNAGAWYEQAQAYGFVVGSTPRAGAIMVTAESYLGHVAYIESVNPNGSWAVSEMNYAGGFGVVSSRTLSPGQIPVIGFIY